MQSSIAGGQSRCVSSTADIEETCKNSTFEVEENVGGRVIETVASHSMGILIMFMMVSRHMVVVRVHIASICRVRRSVLVHSPLHISGVACAVGPSVN
jgi:hypothetical protein